MCSSDLGGGGSGNTGSGGSATGYGSDGGGSGTSTGGNGSSGVVVIYYASSTNLFTGGTITSYTVGATVYKVHTFTSSGTLTKL